MRKFLDYNGGPGVLSASNILETVSIWKWVLSLEKCLSLLLKSCESDFTRENCPVAGEIDRTQELGIMTLTRLFKQFTPPQRSSCIGNRADPATHTGLEVIHQGIVPRNTGRNKLNKEFITNKAIVKYCI